jgi:hypothetical protein
MTIIDAKRFALVLAIYAVVENGNKKEEKRC